MSPRVLPPRASAVGAGDQIIRRDIHVIYLYAGKAFLENRQDFLGIDLRQGAVKIDHPFLRALRESSSRLCAPSREQKRRG